MVKSNKFHVFLLAAAVLLSFPCMSQAAPVWVSGTSDSVYYSDSDNEWQVRGGHEIIASTATLPFGGIGFAEFDLTTIPSGMTYDFMLHLKDTGGDNSTTEISYYVGDGSITGDDVNVGISGVLGSVTRPASEPPTDLNVTDIVRSFLASSYDYIGFKFSPISGSDAFGFVDYWTFPEKRSGLLYEETVIPIPGAIWLFGTGLIGLVGVRRKFKS